MLVDVELDRPVHGVHGPHPSDGVREGVRPPRRRRVRHHGARSVVVLAVLEVQVRRSVPEVRLLARRHEPRHVHALPPHLGKVPDELLPVLGVEHPELRKQPRVRLLVRQPGVQQLDDLVKVAALLVERHDVAELRGLHHQGQAARLCEPKLPGAYAPEAHRPPHRQAVGPPGALHGLPVLAELDVHLRQPRPVLRDREQHLGSAPHLLVEAALADVLEVGGRPFREELLEVREPVAAAVAVHDLGVDRLEVVGALAHRQEVLDDDGVLRVLCVLPRALDDQHVVRGVPCAHEALDALLDDAALHHGPAEQRPDVRTVDPRRILRGAVEVLDVVDEHRHRLVLAAKLLVDRVCLLEQLRADGDPCNVARVEVVEPVDVLHDALALRLDRRQDEQVLQVLVAPKGGAARVHDELLQQGHEHVRHVRDHERLHRRRDLFGLLHLEQGGGGDLVHCEPAERVFRVQHARPQVRARALHHVPRLLLEHGVVVGQRKQLLVAQPPLVSDEGQVRVAPLAELADDAAVVVRVGPQKVLCVDAAVDVHLGQPRVDLHVRAPVRDERLQKLVQHLEPAALLHLDHQFAHRQHVLHREDELYQLRLGRRLQVEQRAHDDGRSHRVHALHKCLHKLAHVVLHHVLHHLLHVAEPVAHVDEGTRVTQLGLHEELLHLLRVVVVAQAGDPLHLAELLQLHGGHNVLVVHHWVVRVVDDRLQVVVHAVRVLAGLERRQELLWRHVVAVRRGNSHAQLHVAARVRPDQLLQHLHSVLRAELSKVPHHKLLVQQVGVCDDALDVGEVGVVLQGQLKQSAALAQHANLVLVVVVPDVLREDLLPHARHVHE
mmetsp:Transcript_1444/g.4314  ORF Transcript_1444/g.4314 Transcript_1444/m.4314 type:complete len:835 (-) Transcript_1444:1882-4386(-)